MPNGLAGRAQTLGRTDPQNLRELVSPASGQEPLTVIVMSMPRYVNSFACARVPFQRLNGLVPPETGAGSHPLLPPEPPAVRRWVFDEWLSPAYQFPEQRATYPSQPVGTLSGAGTLPTWPCGISIGLSDKLDAGAVGRFFVPNSDVNATPSPT